MVDDFSLIDPQGQPFGADDLRGKVWIATVIFTRSQSNTPQQVAQMRALQQHLCVLPIWGGIQLVTLTAEPEVDTPDVLADYALKVGADANHWRFLTGQRDALIDLVEDLGLPVRDEARTHERPISLSPRFVLVDRNMQVRGVYDAFTVDHLNALMDALNFVLPEMTAQSPDSGQTHLVIPPENNDLAWVQEQQYAQVEAAARLKVFSHFQFADQRPESGINFRHQVTDNAAKAWIPNHYDHGNPVSVADVDGDGRLDLYFVNQVGANGLWRNLGRGQFEDITAQAGVGLADQTSIAASFADLDNDGDADLYVTNIRTGNTLLLNDGSGRFTDATATAGLGYQGHSSGAVFFDYNRDGWLDLFLVNVGVYTEDRLIPVSNGTTPEQSGGRHQFYEGRADAFIAHLYPERSEPSRLYRNEGNGRFTDVTEAVGLHDAGWSGDATPIDGNDDGWPDLYVLNMQGQDGYYENVEGQRFVDKSRDLFPKTPWGTMGVKVFDHDNDGRQDLYLTDMHSDMSEDVMGDAEMQKSHMQWPDSLLQTQGQSLFGNAFFHKTGRGQYAEVSDQIGAENYWPWGVSVGDLNADGYDDVFVTSSMNFPFRYTPNIVLLNNAGEGFINTAYLLGAEPRRDGRTRIPWFTLACEGVDRGHEQCHGRRGNVLVWGAVGSRSSAILDLDDDGDLDVVTNDFNTEPMVLVSNLSARKRLHYLKVKLVGTTSNRDGLGAMVTVRAGGNTYTKVHDGVTGYLAHGLQPLYFGLGEADQVDAVEVLWPSGKRQRVRPPRSLNTTLEVREE